MLKGLFFMHNSGHQGFVTTKTPWKWEKFILFFFCLFHFSDSVCYDTHNCGNKKVVMSQRVLTHPQSAPLKCWKAKTLRSWPVFIVGLVQFILLKIYFKKKMKMDKNGPCVLIQRFVSDFTRWFTHPASLWDFPSVLSHQKTHTTKKWKACEFDAVNTAGRQIWFQIAGSDYYFLTCHRRCATEHELRIKVGGGKGSLLTTRTICHYVVHKTARKMEISFDRFGLNCVLSWQTHTDNWRQDVKANVSVLTGLLFCPTKIRLANTSSSLSEREAIDNPILFSYYLFVIICNYEFSLSYTSLLLLKAMWCYCRL